MFTNDNCHNCSQITNTNTMSKNLIVKPKEFIDESNIDWSTFGDDWAKLYYGNDKTPPELNKPLSPDELMETLRKIKD